MTDLLIRRARLVALLALLLTGAALWQAQHIRIAVDLSGLIGPASPGAQAIRDYTARFAPIRAEEALLVAPPNLADDATLAALESLVLGLQFVDGVDQVISLFSLPGPDGSGPWLTSPQGLALPAAERLARLRATDPLAAQLLSADLSATVIIAIPVRGAGPGFLDEVRAAARASGLNAQLIGLAEVQRAVATELIRDLRVLTPLAVVICLVLSAVLFRGWRAVAICAGPPVVGLIWCGGLLGASGMAIDPIMGALPVVLIVLGFSDSLHIYHAGLAHAGQGDAPRRAMAETWGAAVLTSVTTMVAFASLALAGSPSLSTLALTGTLGVAVVLVAVLVLVPVLMELLRAPGAGAAVPPAFAAVVGPARAVLRWRWVPWAGLALCAALALVQSQSTAGFRYADYLPLGAPVTQALARADALGLGADRLVVVVEAAPEVAPGGNARAAALALWGDASAAWLDGPAGAQMLARMRAGDGSAHALPVQVPISPSGAAADAGVRAIDARLAAAGLASVARVVGPGHALVTEGPALAQNLRQGLYLTVAVVTVLIALTHRSWRLAAVAVVPNLIPILGVESWLVLTGREISLMNMIALTVAFGIAVDDTLHFLNRLALAPPGPPRARLDAAVVAAGPPMAATTLILVAGLVVTLCSSLPGLAVFGGLIALAVVLALLADLFLLPAMLLRFGAWSDPR